MNAFKLTQADVGRKVINSRGDEGYIVSYCEFEDGENFRIGKEKTRSYDDYWVNERGRREVLTRPEIINFAAEGTSTEETPTLQAAKYYRTRDGRKAFVVGIGAPFRPDDEDQQVVGWIDGQNRVMTWAINGTHILHRQSNADIVSAWKEPKRIKGWLNVYSEESDHPYISRVVLFGTTVKVSTYAKTTKSDADRAASYFPELKRIACIEIDILEGEGLNGEVA